MDSANEREADVQLLDELLGITLPDCYRKFLTSRGSGMVHGLPVFGLPLSLDQTSVWSATEFVCALRPDLGPEFVAIRLMDTRALCLDMRGAPRADAPLVEVRLEGTDAPIRVHESLAGYLEAGRRTERQIGGILNRTQPRESRVWLKK